LAGKLEKNQNYAPPTHYLFLNEKRKLKRVERVKKQIAKFDLKQEDLGFAIT
jgi:transposase